MNPFVEKLYYVYKVKFLFHVHILGSESFAYLPFFCFLNSLEENFAFASDIKQSIMTHWLLLDHSPPPSPRAHTRFWVYKYNITQYFDEQSIYIYSYVYACVCVCVCIKPCVSRVWYILLIQFKTHNLLILNPPRQVPQFYFRICQVMFQSFSWVPCGIYCWWGIFLFDMKRVENQCRHKSQHIWKFKERGSGVVVI